MATLYHMPNSPFARKVVAIARETQQMGDIELVEVEANPVTANSHLNELNPMARVPIYVGDDGHRIVDSRVICEYLDSRHQGRKMFPTDPAARLQALQHQALADGMIEAISVVLWEKYARPPDLTWKVWQRGHINKARRTAQFFDQQIVDIQDRVDIGTISIACALAMIDYGTPDVDWRADAPALAGWYAEFSQRPSLAPIS